MQLQDEGRGGGSSILGAEKKHKKGKGSGGRTSTVLQVADVFLEVQKMIRMLCPSTTDVGERKSLSSPSPPPVIEVREDFGGL